MTRQRAVSDATGATFQTLTPSAVGGVALIHLAGPGAAAVCEALTCDAAPDLGQVRRADFDGLDDGLVACLPGGVLQLALHGGPAIVQAVQQRLEELGAERGALDVSACYPEAAAPIDADVLQAIAGCASPAAIDALARQPVAWRRAIRDAQGDGRQALRSVALLRRGLDRLLDPPTVALVGPPNAGKSTLLNRLAGRKAAVTDARPGATRDRVAVAVEHRGVVVRWMDTPGIRADAGRIEAAAQRAALPAVARADLVVVLADQDRWPDFEPSTERPVVWARNKADLDALPAGDLHASPGHGASRQAALRLSGKTGEGVDALVGAVLTQLGLAPEALARQEPWAFSATLRRWLEGEDDPAALAAYVGAQTTPD
ncbi:MAG: GTPase [Planctomycetota bacterium]